MAALQHMSLGYQGSQIFPLDDGGENLERFSPISPLPPLLVQLLFAFLRILEFYPLSYVTQLCCRAEFTQEGSEQLASHPLCLA